jgi:hypothetical protein
MKFSSRRGPSKTRGGYELTGCSRRIAIARVCRRSGLEMKCCRICVLRARAGQFLSPPPLKTSAQSSSFCPEHVPGLLFGFRHHEETLHVTHIRQFRKLFDQHLVILIHIFDGQAQQEVKRPGHMITFQYLR